MKTREQVIEAVAKETVWWVEQRLKKLRGEMHDTMAVNPFLMPILYELHHASGFADLGSLLLAGHLMGGHNTGFGKLMDEKILPNVFNTEKLDKGYRKNAPYTESRFDDIDHVVTREDGKYLVSLKASKWTIQLGQAVGLNNSFHEIHTHNGADYKGIVVGIIYGSKNDLTDKYDIAIGIQRKTSAVHGIKDLSGYAVIKAGKEFWAWVNGDQAETQTWMMEGILKGLNDANVREESEKLLGAYVNAFNKNYETHVNEDGKVNWFDILAKINE